YLVVAFLLTYHAKSLQGDAFSRVASAYYVLFSREPHLAAIGFVWNPLPSFLELPILVLLRPLHLALVAGSVLTVLASGANLVLMQRIVRQIGVDGWLCFVLV